MCYFTEASGEIQALRWLLEAVELEGVLVQAVALHTNLPFPLPSPARRRLPVDASLPGRSTSTNTGASRDFA